MWVFSPRLASLEFLTLKQLHIELPESFQLQFNFFYPKRIINYVKYTDTHLRKTLPIKYVCALDTKIFERKISILYAAYMHIYTPIYNIYLYTPIYNYYI